MMDGVLVIKLQDRNVVVRQGQFVIIPRGVEQVHGVLVEPRTTLDTGIIRDDKTVEAEWI
jgi:mannose-6-phosphate isomerase-like protein (cupin superfamily)